MVQGREVKSGICYQDSKLVCGVVVQQDYCDEGTWEPPFVVAHSEHAQRSCASSPYKILIGRCGNNEDGTPGICSNSASRCDDPSAFVARDPSCTITHDSLATEGETLERTVDFDSSPRPFRQWTTYGSCNDRCVWSSDDCVEDEAYITNNPDCTADKVSIGACLDGYAYCVVTKDNCKTLNGNQEPYLSHQEVLDTFNANCYLANLGTIVSPSVPSPPPTPNPTGIKRSTFNPTSPTYIASAAMPDETMESKNSELSSVVIIGICVGCAALAFIVTLGIQMHIQRKHKLKQWQVAKVPPVPAQSIAIDMESEKDISVLDD